MSVNKNWLAAETYFISIGAMPPREQRTETWVLHHIDPSWKTEDPVRYSEWRIADLVPMTQSQHTALHNSIREITDEMRQNMSKNHADVSGENNPMYGVRMYGEANGMFGKHHSDEAKQKMSWKVQGRQNPMQGRKHSEESKQKMREAKLRRKQLKGLASI